VALKSYVAKRFGYDGWRKYLSALEPKVRKQVEMPSAREWYELDVMLRALHSLRDVFGEEQTDVVGDFGRHEAERDMSTVHRLFFRLANPAYVLEKATEYWRSFCDFGEWQVVRDSSHGATATLVGVPVVDEVYCQELSGYLQRLFELVGAKNVKSEHARCRARGDETCVWVGSWD
jgi:predicted hydrocarbon binding protein